MALKKKPRHWLLPFYDFSDKLKHFMGMAPCPQLTIVTAADATHSSSLVQLVKSILIYEKKSKLIVYDLGLEEAACEKIKKISDDIELRVFNFNKYPDYFNIKINAGEFAWKPLIIKKTADEFGNLILWVDAGCLLTQPLYWIRKILIKEGFYSPICSDNVGASTHFGTLEFLKVTNDISSKKSLCGTVVGFDYNRPKCKDLLCKWCECSMIKECIAPEGSNRENHRQDQSLLSILAYKAQISPDIPLRHIGIKLHQDID